ncbi:ROK family transcriptional regulator [Symbioplanes lichenis]|uniref:ROK family transcriptional regulator n=1 Tax=Symbioplanes lichenis TaxID=1629072 RepID=UPI002739D90A|nr:ROK family transcriptional regulator [Actinoplanes lichenis]
MPVTEGVHALVRRAHEERVLALLRERGALSRAQIATHVGLSRTTLSEITGELLARGAIVKVNTDAEVRTGSGRPAELLALDPHSGQFLGVDLGHNRVRVAVADAAHEIIVQGHSSYAAETPWSDRLSAAFALIERVSRESGVTFRALQGVGVGVAGPRPAADVREEVLASFGARFSAPVTVDNNTRFAALAEAMTAGDEARDLLYLRLSDGIGGGLVVGGRLVAGRHGGAGEFGHLLADRDGDVCRCGRRGCLETVASVPAVLRAARLAAVEDLAVALDAGEPVATAAIERAAQAVSRALAGAAQLLDPEEIVIGGRLVAAAPGIVARTRELIEADLSAGPRIRAARLGDDDGARGAIAALYRQSPLLAGYPDSAVPADRGLSDPAVPADRGLSDPAGSKA